MKVYISVDLEGVTGTTSWECTNLGNIEHGAAAAQMKQEALAAALGAIDAGATEVYIKDAHDTGRNIDITGFPKECRFIRDWICDPASMVGGLDETFDALLFVGYHSPAGFNRNPLSHTMNLGNNYVRFNGQICSEFLMHALYAAELGVPAVFLSGDQGLCDHAHEYDSQIRTVAVKDGIGGATISITPEEACRQIREQAKEGVLNRANCHMDVPETLTMEICFKEHSKAYRASFFPGVKQTGPYTVEYTGHSVKEVASCRMFIL
ncbi:MAG: M55 family metallopeptidase [Lachnospiraceae bacterium]|nr:M55 family metallopeptidase [Lachnospiraceae bacterium]